MKITRRDFMKSAFLLGGSFFLPTAAAPAAPKGVERWIPAYERLEIEGRLAQRIKQAYAIFEKCELCPRRCGVSRKKGEKGFCRAPV